MKTTIVALAMATFLVAGDASAEKVFKLGLASPPANPEAVAAVKFAEYVDELSEGELRIDVLSGGQAGGEREIAEAMQIGTMDFGVLAGILQNFDPALMIVEWDLLFKNNDHVRAAMNGEIGDVVSQRLIDNVGIRKLTTFMRTPRLLTTNVPIESVDDLEGLKIRVPEMRARVEIWKSLGAQPTPMSFPDVVPALQLGTIDGQENPIGIISSAKMYEAVGYLADTKHLYGFMLLLVSEGTWNSLSDSEKSILADAAARAAQFNDQLVAESEAEMMKEVSGEMTVTEPDLGPWREKSQEVYLQFSDVEGFADLYEKIVELGEDY